MHGLNISISPKLESYSVTWNTRLDNQLLPLPHKEYNLTSNTKRVHKKLSNREEHHMKHKTHIYSLHIKARTKQIQHKWKQVKENMSMSYIDDITNCKRWNGLQLQLTSAIMVRYHDQSFSFAWSPAEEGPQLYWKRNDNWITQIP